MVEWRPGNCTNRFATKSCKRSAERSRGGCAKPSSSSILSCWRGNFQNSSRFLHTSCWNDPMSTAPLETRASTVPSEVADRLRSIVGERNCIVESSQLRTYESDGLTSFHAMPGIVVLSDGEVVDLGGPVADAPGYALLGVLVGSEGTLGIVTEVVLRILRKPQATRTFLATFPSTEEAGNAVSAIIAGGIVPAAIEMMDRLAIVAAKAATGVDWPDVGAVLLMDVDGPLAEVEHTSAAAIEMACAAGALEIRRPKDEDERALLWKGRRSAFAAVGRISPNYVVQDGVIPRSEIARVLGEIETLSRESGLRIANVFHAGDGNLHPLVLYDAKVAGQEKLAEDVAGEILRVCLRFGGSITGEHGVGADKTAFMAEMFNESDLETMNRIRCAFDPQSRFNPGKVFPTPRLCGDRPGIYRPHSAELSGQADRV